VVGEGLLAEDLDFPADAEEGLKLGGLVLVRGEGEASEGTLDVAPGVDDGVAVAGHLPVLGVVVAVTDAEGAHLGAELTHVNVLAADVSIDLGETSTELGRGALAGVDDDLLPRLTVVSEHLLKRVSAALTKAEVGELDSARDNALLANAAGGAWLGGGSGGVAAHFFKSKISL